MLRFVDITNTHAGFFYVKRVNQSSRKVFTRINTFHEDTEGDSTVSI
jgi:hypothetical protein